MNVESTVQKICNCLDALLCEAKAERECNARICNDRDTLHHELRRKVHVTLEKIENYPEIKGIVIKFVQTCYAKKCCCDHLTFLQMSLVLLRLLQKALSQEEADSCTSKSHGGCKLFMPRGLLSISQQKVLKKCFQFIVGLGILPNLLRGIGVPLSRRLQHSNVLENFSTDSTCYQKHVQLVICLETLLDCLECDAMQSILFSYHGTDLFATLLQLCHAPIKKIEKSQMTAVKVPSSDKIEFRSMLAAIRDNSHHSECEVVTLMLLHRNHFTHRLEKFLNQISPSLLIWELILFQGIPMRSDISEMAITRCPGWMRKICNQMLTDLVLQSHGIVSLVQAVLDKAFDMDVESGKVDTKQMEAVAHLITLNCVRHLSLENYMQRLSKQVFQLLHLKGSQMDSLLKFVASCIVLQFYARDRLLGENCFFKKIVEPLWKCVLKHDNCLTKVIVKEKELTTCIEELYQIFISCTLPLRRNCIKILFPLFHCLSTLYFYLVKGTSFLKSKVKELLIGILSAASNEEALALLYVVTIPNCQHLDVHQTTVSFTNGEEGGVIAVQKKKKAEDFDVELLSFLGIPNRTNSFFDWKQSPEFLALITEEIACYHALLDLISELQNKELNSSFILLIMKEYCSFHLEVKETPFDACNFRVRVAFSALLQELSEWNADIGEALISNISEVMDLLMTLLESICNYRTDAPFYEETAMVVLMILSSLLTSENHELTSNDWLCIKKCLPSLQKLQKCDIDADLKEMLLSVLIHIATHGAACITDTEEVREFLRNYPDLETRISESNNETDDDSSSESQSIEALRESFIEAGKIINRCEELESNFVTDLSDLPKTQVHIQEEKNIPNYFSNMSLNAKPTIKPPETQENYLPYEVAMKYARDSEIPIRSNGLRELGKLISKKDEEALQNKEELLQLFQENLKDEDTYVYLPAIQGLGNLSEIDVELVLPVVLEVYQNTQERFDVTLKMGETLSKILDFLGDMIYKYRDQILHACLIGTKHINPQIRSSSLSNLGQACICLGFSIPGHWLQEIVICVLSFLKTDKDLEVRRCAVMVVFLLLKGIGKEMLQMLENEMHTLYTQLKLVFNTEQDDVLHIHSQLALDQITNIMKDLLFTPEPLTKELRILP